MLSLSTHWNASRHSAGEAMIEEILELGFSEVELGYDLRIDLVAGVRKLVEQGAVRIGSVHGFCPVPVGAPYGHPELFLLASRERRSRESAVLHVTNTIKFAAEIGAPVVNVHAGRVRMGPLTPRLLALCEKGKQYSAKYEKTRTKLLLRREQKAAKFLEPLYRSLEELLPILQEHKVCLALENLPSWEAIPSEPEMEAILAHFKSPHLGYWHDIGHGQIRQTLGLVTVSHWLGKLKDGLAGMHVHDVAPPAYDHLMPPHGKVDFAAFQPYARPELPLALEPMPGTPAEEISKGLRLLQEVWFP